MAARGNQPKIMSGRLAGMKFMQRAGGSATTRSTPNDRPTKKQRLSSGFPLSTPSMPVEDQQRAEEVDREGYNKGETKWYLSFQAPQTTKTDSPLRVVSAGYSALDSGRRTDQSESEDEDDDDDDDGPTRPTLAGRRSFGKFNTKVDKQNNPAADDTASEDEEDEDKEEDADIGDDPTGVKTLIAKGKKEAAARVRSERKAQKAADSAEAQQLARHRRAKDLNLNKVTSISFGGGSSSARGSPNAANMACHACDNKGHIKRDCLQKKQSKSRLSY